MKLHIVVVIILVGLAFGGGWFTSGYNSKKNVAVPTAQTTQTTQQVTDNTSAYPPVYDIYSGTGMTTDELYETLDKLTGTDFDKRYINYTILLQGYMTGLDRLAKDRAVAPALKDRALTLWQQDTQRMDDFFVLQKQLGYTHH